MIEIHRLDTPSLGDRSYLATDGAVALVVDPQRDIDRVLALAGNLGVRITHVFETHMHNDYLTGGLALARETGAAYHVSAADQVAFDRVPVSDGDVLEITPSSRIQVLATCPAGPGMGGQPPRWRHPHPAARAGRAAGRDPRG
jgi:hydroxyacylglutathione hydrolase